MKKLFLFFVSVIMLAFIVESCKKKDKDTSKTTLQKIQAKWSIESIIDNDYSSSEIYRDTTVGTAVDYIDFRSDGRVYSFIDNLGDTAAYSLNGDTAINVYSESYRIQSLTDHMLTLYAKENDPLSSDYSEEFINLKK